MMDNRVKKLVVKSLCSVLIISALILSFSVYTNSINIAGEDKVGGELVKSEDKVGGELVSADSNDYILVCTPEDKIGGGIM